MSSTFDANASVVNLAPYTYCHIQDLNTSVTRCMTGPTRYTKKDNEIITLGSTRMLNLPPESYISVENPVLRNENNEPIFDEYGQVKVDHGNLEIRCSRNWTEPFALYPGEKLQTSITKLTVVEKNTALLLKATRKFLEEIELATDEQTSTGIEVKEDDSTDYDLGTTLAVGKTTIEHNAGDEWLFKGPATYIPRAEVKVLSRVEAYVVKKNSALRLRARRKTIDANGISRKAGEEWLIRASGAYLPSVDEEVIKVEEAQVITDKTALHLRATNLYTDIYGKDRKAGEEWLVTSSDADNHIADVYEEVVNVVHVTSLTNREYCVIVNPWINGVQKLGTQILRKGECSFFLQPGEVLEDGVQKIEVLQEDEALLLQADEDFEDNVAKVKRTAGDRWLLRGPCEYLPCIEAKVIERRRAIPLDTNEGIYVRDNRTGGVRAVKGSTYLLAAHEQLWNKELPTEVEDLLIKQNLGQGYVVLPDEKNSSLSKANFQRNNKGLSKLPSLITLSNDDGSLARKGKKTLKNTSLPSTGPRDQTRVVKFRVPHNCAMQVYDYKKKTSRILIGPDMVMLEPDEMFSVLRLSGDKPKRPNMIKSLVLQLGPDFMTDIVTVETSDHARLQLTLSYNWHFDVSTPENMKKIFNVRDFTGTACKALASRVRGACAAITFDSFHKNSAKVIRSSIFGRNKETGKVKDCLDFPQNSLKITNVDIQSVEPVDHETRKSLQKSVQMAITITTNSQEASARHQAMAEEEEAKGHLEQQRLKNKSEAEKRKKQLLELKALSAAVETSGQAKAEAQALAEAEQIRVNAQLEQAKTMAEAVKIKAEEELAIMKAKNQAMIEHQKALNELEVAKAKALAEVETVKFKQTVDAIGANTIAEIARAGPETQAKLLQSLGIKSTLITDGSSPINLFQTANGLIGNNVETKQK